MKKNTTPARSFIMLMAVILITSLSTAAFSQTPASSPDIDAVKKDMIYARAVNAAVWGMPLLNFDAMRQAYFRDAGAGYNDVIYFSKFANWKFQTTTPNNSTNYVMFFVNLKNGPVVVDVPPVKEVGLFGSLISAWTMPLIDVGNNGEDKGKGGKYLLLPPDYKGTVPSGYIPVSSETYNVYSLMRVIPKSNSKADVDKAIAFLHSLKIYPQNNPRQENRYIDIYDKTFNGIAPYDFNYYVALDRMVKEEPVMTKDLVMMGMLNSIGIGKDIDFNPDAATKAILTKAINAAHAYMVDGWEHSGDIWWPNKKWRSLPTRDMVLSDATAVLPDRMLMDDRSFLYFGAFGPAKNPLPNLYVKTFTDAGGNELNGSNTYKLNVPANMPSTQFWSVIAQDVETAGFITGAQNVGINSFQALRKNSDGSVDIYFSPKAPKGYENNWVSTAEGKRFFLLFRNYGATKDVLGKKSPWTLNDVEKIK